METSKIEEVRGRLEQAAEIAATYGEGDDLRALLAAHARLQADAERLDWRVPVMRPQPAPAIDLEQFRSALVALSDYAYERHGDADHPHCVEADRLLALIDGQANVRSSSEHSSEVAADLVTDDAVRRLVRAMENTPGDELIEPNTRLCRRLLVAAMQPTKGEGVAGG